MKISQDGAESFGEEAAASDIRMNEAHAISETLIKTWMTFHYAGLPAAKKDDEGDEPNSWTNDDQWLIVADVAIDSEQEDDFVGSNYEWSRRSHAASFLLNLAFHSSQPRR